MTAETVEKLEMRCPQCGVDSLTAGADRCGLCGFSPSDSVVATKAQADELQEKLQAEFKDRFTLIAPVGFTEGSFLYLARDPARVTPVAVKIIPFDKSPAQGKVARFESDAARIQSLENPLLLRLLDFGVTGHFLWYSREYALGDSLEEMLRKSGPMALGEALALVGQAGSALGYLHSRDFCHGNLIPSNIFVDQSIARLSDAGVAYSLNGLTLSNRRASKFGAVDYLAPEVFESHSISPGADQYALATILYESLAGKHPFIGDSPEEVGRLHQTSTPTSLDIVRPDVPIHVAQTVARAMAKKPDARFADISEFGRALDGGVKEPVRLPSARPSAEPRSSQVLYVEGQEQKSRLRSFVLASIIILALTISSVLYWKSQHPVDTTGLEPNWSSSLLTTDRRSVPEPTSDSGDPGDTSSSEQQTQRPPSSSDRANNPPAQPVAAPVVVRRAPTRRTIDRTPGQLSINSTPWGLVYLDGQLLGNSPKINLSVAPGEHNVRVVRVGFTTFEQTVTLAPGENLRLTGIVLEERRP